MLFFQTIKYKPEWILSYDGMSVLPAFIVSKLTKAKWVYHQHDYWEKPKGWLRFPYACEQKLTKYAHIISFPQVDRAKLFKKENKIKKNIEIVFNGPRLDWAKNKSEDNFIKKIKDENPNQKIIIYQGGWAKCFAIQNIIAALKFIPDLSFVILGKPLEPGILNFYKKIAEENKVGNRVFYVEQVPYFKLPDYTAFADIGATKFSFDENEAVNDLLLAGASNKIAEYCACGLPVLAPATAVNNDFIEKEGRGLTCKPSDLHDIAQKIELLLKNKNKFAENNLSDFKNRLNYDSQFEKILKKLNSNV